MKKNGAIAFCFCHTSSPPSSYYMVFIGAQALLWLQVRLSIMWNNRSALISSAGGKINQKVGTKTRKMEEDDKTKQQHQVLCGFIDCEDCQDSWIRVDKWDKRGHMRRYETFSPISDMTQNGRILFKMAGLKVLLLWSSSGLSSGFFFFKKRFKESEGQRGRLSNADGGKVSADLWTAPSNSGWYGFQEQPDKM